MKKNNPSREAQTISVAEHLTDEQKHSRQQNADLAAIHAATDPERNEGFETEILYCAFLHMRSHPTATIEQCINDGFCEWVGK